jgi:hypothetical protein
MTRYAAASPMRGSVGPARISSKDSRGWRSTGRLISLPILLFAVLAPGGIGRAAGGAGRHSVPIGVGRRAAGVMRLPNGTLLPVGPERTRGELLARRDGRRLLGCTKTFHRSGFPENVRVNTDCGGAGQQEELVAVNPTDQQNVIVSQTGAFTAVHYSLRGGEPGSFGDSGLFTALVPCDPRPPCGPGGLWSYDLFTDPAHAFDPQGNLYMVAIGYDFLQDSLNGIYVWKSNACGKGRALGNPSDPRCFPINGIPAVLHDNFANRPDQDFQPKIASGPRPNDPRGSQIAAVWSTAQYGCGPAGSDLCAQPGFLSLSTDGGRSWTTPKDITGRAPFCVGGDAFTGRHADAHACNLDDQGGASTHRSRTSTSRPSLPAERCENSISNPGIAQAESRRARVGPQLFRRSVGAARPIILGS